MLYMFTFLYMYCFLFFINLNVDLVRSYYFKIIRYTDILCVCCKCGLYKTALIYNVVL